MADKTDDLIISISTDMATVRRSLKKLEADISTSTKGVVKQFEAMGKGIDNSITSAMQSRINEMVGIGTKASKQWTGALAQQGVELEKLRMRYNPVFAAVRQYQESVVGIQQAHRLGAISAEEMTTAIQRERKATLDSIAAIKQRNSAVSNMRSGPGSFQTANIAAQFQDIAVTSAMGMSPIQIALQQGTQLSAVFNEMGKGRDVIKGIGAAFASIISPVSLVTIGVIAAGAALVQYITTAEKTKSIDEILKEHAAIIQSLGPAYDAVAQKQQQYINQSKDLANLRLRALVDERQTALLDQAQKSIGNLAKSEGLTLLGSRFEAARTAIARFQASVTAGKPQVAAFQEEITRLQKAGELTDKVANALLNATAEAARAETAFSALDTKVDDAAFAAAKFADGLSKISSSKARDELQQLFDKTVQGDGRFRDLIDAINRLALTVPDLSEHRNQLIGLAEAALTARAAVDGFAKSTPKGNREPGLSDAAFNRRYGANDDIINKLESQKKELEKKPKKSSAERQAERDANAYRDLVKSAQDRIDQLKLEEQLVGKTGVAAEAMRMKLELLQRAQDKGRTVTEAQRAEIDKLATAYGNAAQKVSAMQMAEELQFERAQLFRNPTEQRVASQLRNAGISPDSEYGQAIGNQIRLNEQLAIGRDRALDFAQGLANDILNSADAVDILRNSVSRLAQMLVEMGTNNIINGLFANFGGGLFGGGFKANTTLGNFLKGIPGFATGTNSAPGGLALVGERGPELLNIPRGAQVIPNDILGSIARGGVSAPRVPSIPSAANSNGSTGVHVTLGWSKDADGNIAPIIRDVSQQTFKQGIDAYDRGGAVRTARDLRQVNQRGLVK
nr:phage tail length tape measure family protein [Brucella intermedia]